MCLDVHARCSKNYNSKPLSNHLPFSLPHHLLLHITIIIIALCCFFVFVNSTHRTFSKIATEVSNLIWPQQIATLETTKLLHERAQTTAVHTYIHIHICTHILTAG